ncbi:MAG TPA: hypothetical protein PLP27_01225 [Crocinitomicaceae bacterium]|nr:hypothetical protein [Crocinitomicaceae bacterium]
MAMKFTQIALFFLSIIVFDKILKLLNVTKRILWLSLYAFLPLYSGFMYFTITEGISPSIVLFVIFFFLKAQKENKYPIYFTIIASFLIVLRPQLIVLVLILVIRLLFVDRKNIIAVFAFLPFILWNVRSTFIAKDYLGVHPIYHITNNSVYRPPHEALTNLFRQWEHQPEKLHKVTAILGLDTTTQTKNDALLFVPEKYQSSVDTLFFKYQQLEFQRQHYFSDKKIDGYLPNEYEFLLEAKELIKYNKQRYSVDYHFFTPMKSGLFFFNSYLNLYVFQAAFRGKLWCEILRWCCFIVVSFSIVASFIALFSPQKTTFLFALTICLSLFYFAYFQRMNEERYFYPLLPVALLCLVVGIETTSRKCRDDRHK